MDIEPWCTCVSYQVGCITTKGIEVCTCGHIKRTHTARRCLGRAIVRFEDGEQAQEAGGLEGGSEIA